MEQPVKNIRLYDPNIRSAIFKYLRSQVKHKPKVKTIIDTDDLNVVRDGDYIVCPEYDGVRSWVMFFQLENCYYAVNFPKYNEGNEKKTEIFPIDIQVPKSIYQGTIMQGIFYKSKSEHYLIIDELFLLEGKDQLLRSRPDRFDKLNQIISKFKQTHRFHIYVAKYYSKDKTGLTALFNTICSDEYIRQIVFYPIISGKEAYQYTIMEEDRKEDVVEVSIFMMQKTKNPDVYNLYKLNTKTENKNKIGIAHIHDIQASKQWKKAFKDADCEILKVKCEYLSERKKWKPLEVVQ